MYNFLSLRLLYFRITMIIITIIINIIMIRQVKSHINEEELEKILQAIRMHSTAVSHKN